MHKQLNSISFISANSGFSDLQSCSIIKGSNYYIAKSIDQHPELIEQLFETEKLQKSKNIFQDPVNLKILQHDPAIGPKYEKNKIVSRSIVGKPDIFRKKQPTQNIHSNQEFHMPTQQINMQESISLAKKESPLQRRLTQLKVVQSPVKISKQTKNENVITGSELISKIAHLEKRLIQNKLDEQKQFDNMPFFQKQNQYRDQRALEDFDKQEKIHSELLHSLSARISRNPSCSLMMDLYNFRRKQEYSNIVHFILKCVFLNKKKYCINFGIFSFQIKVNKSNRMIFIYQYKSQVDLKYFRFYKISAQKRNNICIQ